MDAARHSDEAYLAADPFQGDEAELLCRSVVLRVARKAHPCYSLNGKRDHEIKPGDRYREERALVDRSFWGRYRLCLGCLDGWLAEFESEDDDD